MSPTLPRKPEPIEYELVASKKGLRIGADGSMKLDRARFDSLPEQSPDQTKIRGSYEMVSAHAVRLNRIQEDSKRIDYIFAPEPSKKVTA